MGDLTSHQLLRLRLGLTLVLSRLLYRVIPAQSKLWELLSFAHPSLLPLAYSSTRATTAHPWWEMEHKEHESWLVGILRDEEMSR